MCFRRGLVVRRQVFVRVSAPGLNNAVPNDDDGYFDPVFIAATLVMMARSAQR